MTKSPVQTQQEYIPMLPEIDTGLSKLEPLRMSDWSASQGVALENISSSLKVPDLPSGERSIDSVPDFWARPLLFQTALFDSNHKLHEQVKAEWRGMIALLALWERRSLRLEVKSLDLPDSYEQTEFPFLKSAVRLCPLEVLSADTSWKKVFIFYYEDRAVGMASPTTLVCTAVDTSGRFDDRVTWQKNGTLSDPIAFLSTEERGLVAFWVKNLANQLNEQLGALKGKSRSILNSLTRLCGDFQKALGTPTDDGIISEKEIGLIAGIYRLLNNPLKPREFSLDESAIALVPSKGFSPALRILVLHEQLAKAWDVNPAELPVYGQTTFASVNFANLDASRTAQIGEEVLQRAVWRTSEMLFCSRLLLIALDNTEAHFQGLREVVGQQKLLYDKRSVVPILPIAAELLDHLSNADLRERLSFTTEKDGSIRVELRLPLMGVDGKRRDFTLRRTYSREMIECRRIVPIIEIWPHFRSDTWKTYYTYYDSTVRRAQEIFVARPHCGAVHQEAIQTAPEFRRGESDVRQLTRTTAPPTALICTAQFPDTQEALEVGCLLLEDFPLVQTTDAIWSFGVDFGTSSSQVYYQSGGSADPEPFEIEVQSLRVTPVSQDDLDRLTTFFLPSFKPESPFLSLFRLELSGERRHPFIRGSVFFLKPKLIINLLSQKGVRSGFKWAAGEEGEQLVKGFLEQLALQCTAAAARQGAQAIRWFVSYPSVFSLGAKTSQRKIWDRIAKESDLPCKELTYRTESEAAARFFKERQRISLTETICIDIGGGTSDISIWEGTILRQQCSVKFAGEGLFMDLLKESPDVLSIFNPEWTKKLTEAKRGTNFYAEADSLLRAGRDEIFDRLSSVIDTSNRQDRLYRFIHLITLGTSGLLFYSGLLVRKLIEEKRWDNRGLPYVCIGGNGSRLFQWLSLGSEFDGDAIQNTLFKAVLKAATGLSETGHYRVHISALPKAEAAYGLIVQSEIDLKKEDEALIDLAGEDFTLEGHTGDTWKYSLDRSMLASGIKAPAQFVFLKQFIDAYNSYAVKSDSLAIKVNYDTFIEKRIRDVVQEQLNMHKGRDEAAIVVEPIFITALKALLRLEIDTWIARK